MTIGETGVARVVTGRHVGEVMTDGHRVHIGESGAARIMGVDVVAARAHTVGTAGAPIMAVERALL